SERAHYTDLLNQVKLVSKFIYSINFATTFSAPPHSASRAFYSFFRTGQAIFETNFKLLNCASLSQASRAFYRPFLIGQGEFSFLQTLLRAPPFKRGAHFT
ncbi:hypothetical protein, partial [Methylobacillus flagellatus]|uniref:hypothetical protein n=1 Tax=Methylobacillus flagellatus TaxID=405 RepID=UPI00286944EE